jgi:hypothetical protein
LEHDPEKLVLGLDPRMENRFPKRSCSVKNAGVRQSIQSRAIALQQSLMPIIDRQTGTDKSAKRRSQGVAAALFPPSQFSAVTMTAAARLALT